MEVTGPFNLTLGQETDVTPPNGSSRFTRVVLANASPYACQVNSGGVAQWLQPWSADVYPCDGGNPAEVTPQFTTSSGSLNGQITASWYLDTDSLNGSYPTSLTAQAIVAANAIQQGELTSGSTATMTGAQTSQTVSLALPVWAKSIGIAGSIYVGSNALVNATIALSLSKAGQSNDPALTAYLYANLAADGAPYFAERYLEIPDPSFDTLTISGPDNGSGGAGYSVGYLITAYGIPAGQMRTDTKGPSIPFYVTSGANLFLPPPLGYTYELDRTVSLYIAPVSSDDQVTITDNFWNTRIVNTLANLGSRPTQIQVPRHRFAGSASLTGSLSGVSYSGSYRLRSLIP